MKKVCIACVISIFMASAISCTGCESLPAALNTHTLCQSSIANCFKNPAIIAPVTLPTILIPTIINVSVQNHVIRKGNHTPATPALPTNSIPHKKPAIVPPAAPIMHKKTIPAPAVSDKKPLHEMHIEKAHPMHFPHTHR